MNDLSLLKKWIDIIDKPQDLSYYFIINNSLGMSTGKIIAQITHAITAINELSGFSKQPRESIPTNLKEQIYANTLMNRVIVLKTDNFTLLKERLARHQSTYNQAFLEGSVDMPFLYNFIVDAGLTEVPAGSTTLAYLFPLTSQARAYFKLLGQYGLL